MTSTPSRSPRDIAIVVVTHNSAHVLDGLLDSLPSALGETPWRTVVVDCGSTDDTTASAAARGDCYVVATRNLGYAAGINRGVQSLGGSGPVLVLNPDVRLSDGFIAPLLLGLAQPGVGIAVPRVLDEDGSLSFSMRREPSLGRSLGLGRTGHPRLSESVSDVASYDRPRVCDWAVGAVMLIDRDCLDELDGWDESYFLYSEETDFCLRARDRGWTTRFVPDATAVHIGGQSGRSSRTRAMQALNRVRLYRRRHGLVGGWAYLLLTIAGELSRILRGDREGVPVLLSLVLPAHRPPELNLRPGYVPH